MVTWILIGSFGLINFWLLYFFISSARFEGAGSAQADLEMFVYLTTLGGAVVIGSVLILIIGYLVNIKTIKLNAALIRNPVVIASLLNIMMPLLLYVSLLMRK